MFPTQSHAGVSSHTALAAFALAAATLTLALTPGWAQTDTAAAASPGSAPAQNGTGITAANIETAAYDGGDLPLGQSALTARVQILLDRSGISPGVVDGWRGGMSESAIKAFQRRAGLPMTGRLDHAVWELLHGYARAPLISEYTITDEDAYGLVDNIPSDYADKARMTSQGYTSILEKLGERFHMDEKFLTKLNPGKSFAPGETIRVALPARPIRATVTRIIVDKQTRRVAAYDARGRLVADYPATVGSAETPSPHGTHVVDTVALNPSYTYNPRRNFKQGENDRVLTIPPGPNGPVGNVWIDLSEPTYGLHGTAIPSRLFVSQSHGCVRLTNWDASELAHMVKAKVTTVEFLPPGVSIADVTGVTAAATVARASVTASIDATRPPARGGRVPPQIVIAASPDPTSTAPTAPTGDALAASLVEAGVSGVAAVSVAAPAPGIVTPETPTSTEPLVPAHAPVVIADEPEYPSDAALPETPTRQPAGAATLYPQAGR